MDRKHAHTHFQMPPKRAKQESKESKVDQVKLLLEQTSKIADQLKTLAAEVEFLPDEIFDANGQYKDGKNENDCLDMLRQLSNIADNIQSTGSDLDDMGKRVRQVMQK